MNAASTTPPFTSLPASAPPLRVRWVEYPYLMADPACPHLAPWSPAEPETTP